MNNSTAIFFFLKMNLKFISCFQTILNNSVSTVAAHTFVPVPYKKSHTNRTDSVMRVVVHQSDVATGVVPHTSAVCNVMNC